MMSPTLSGKPCCFNRPSGGPRSHALDCNARFSNGNLLPGRGQKPRFDGRVTSSGNAFASTPSTKVWQAAKAMTCYDQEVQPKNNDMFLIQNSDSWETVLAPDREQMANLRYRRGGMGVSRIDILSLAPLDENGQEIQHRFHINQHRNEVVTLAEAPHLFEPGPVFQVPLDMSESGSETNNEDKTISSPRALYPFQHQHPHYHGPVISPVPSPAPELRLLPPRHVSTHRHETSSREARRSHSPQNNRSHNSPLAHSIRKIDHGNPTDKRTNNPARKTFPSKIPQEIRDIATTLNSCPEDERIHDLPARIWVKKQSMPCVEVRYATFKRHGRHPNSILEWVGDTRLFTHRMWAYMLYAGKAVPQGEGAYEKEYEEDYGEYLERSSEGDDVTAEKQSEHVTQRPITITSASHFAPTAMMITAQADVTTSTPSEPTSYGAVTQITEVSSPSNKNLRCTFKDTSSTNSGTALDPDIAQIGSISKTIFTNITTTANFTSINEFETNKSPIAPPISPLSPPHPPTPTPSPPLTPDLLPCRRAQGPCTNLLTQPCSPLRQPCINHSTCSQIICRACAHYQLSHLTPTQQASVQLGALMPLCQTCQTTFLSKGTYAGSTGLGMGVEEKESECLCLEYQCLSCLIHTSEILEQARNEYERRGMRRFSTRIEGTVCGVYICVCGCDIQGAMDEVRVCAACGGRVLRRDYWGGGLGWWGRARGVKYLAGCGGVLR